LQDLEGSSRTFKLEVKFILEGIHSLQAGIPLSEQPSPNEVHGVMPGRAESLWTHE